MASGADITLRNAPVTDVRLYLPDRPRADVVLTTVSTDPYLSGPRTTAPTTVAPPPSGVTHDGQMASVGTSTSTFAARLTIAATLTSAGTSTSTFTGDLLGAGPSVIVINRGIRTRRGQGTGRR